MVTTANGVFDDPDECAVCGHSHDRLNGRCDRLVRGAVLTRNDNGKTYTTVYYSKCPCRTSVRH